MHAPRVVVRSLSSVSLTDECVETESAGDAPQSARRRLSQAIADTHLLSRREAERLVRGKRVTVNGAVIASPSFLLDAQSDAPLIEIDGVPIKNEYPQGLEFPRIWAVLKQKHEIVGAQDQQKSRSLLLDRVANSLLPEVAQKYSLRPVYRLDYVVEGLVLLTNSAELARMFDSTADGAGGGKSGKGYTKHFRVRVHGKVSESKLDGLRRGLIVDDKKYQPMDISVQRKSNTISWLSISTTEKQSQAVQKCLKALFLDVTRIICVGYGPYKVDDIFPEGSTHGVMELKLDPAINAQYLRLFNAKTARTFVK